MLHKFSKLLVACTVILILAGSLVTSHDAGLWIAEPRGWLRWLGVGALGTVIAQGVLGGLTVLFFLPPAISTAHAGLAEIFFCLTVAIALFTSPGWKSGYGGQISIQRSAQNRDLMLLATTTTVLIYTQ